MDNDAINSFERSMRGIAAQDRSSKRIQHAAELKTFDASQLSKMTPAKLAEWQSKYQQDEPQWVLADQEWKRRGGISTRRIALAAIAVSALSFIIAAFGYFFPKTTPASYQEKALGQAGMQSQSPTQSLPASQILNSHKVGESTNLDSSPILKTQLR